jgi:hypothetical protein
MNIAIFDYYFAKYAAADGVLLWEKRFNGACRELSRPRPQRDGAITGSSGSSGSMSDGWSKRRLRIILADLFADPGMK